MSRSFRGVALFFACTLAPRLWAPNEYLSPSPMPLPYFYVEGAGIYDHFRRAAGEYADIFPQLSPDQVAIGRRFSPHGAILETTPLLVSNLHLSGNYRVDYSEAHGNSIELLLTALWEKRAVMSEIKDLSHFLQTGLGHYLGAYAGGVRAGMIYHWLKEQDPSLDELRLLAGLAPKDLKSYPVLYRFGNLRDPPAFFLNNSVIKIAPEGFARVTEDGMPPYGFVGVDFRDLHHSYDEDVEPLTAQAHSEAEDFVLERFRELVPEGQRHVFNEEFIAELRLIAKQIPIERQMWFVVVDLITGELESVFSIMDGTTYSSFDKPVRLALEHSLDREVVDRKINRRVFEIRRLAGKKLSKGILQRTARLLVQHIHYLEYDDQDLFLLHTDNVGGRAFGRFGFTDYAAGGEIPAGYHLMGATAGKLKTEIPVPLPGRNRNVVFDPLNATLTADPRYRHSMASCLRVMIGATEIKL